ncbi:YjcZ family sporulation protein [Paenibacillus oenotherae]|uniref:YjcZ family sporulation protein n=1 Tax=Paenibacillus oenotherae TaxID=1435645 RepID=A0ABS7D8R8_9BACL|nr:YjcZ family sporulation protein [Paenibacillus oenotherae]MBW7476265.1 YjcZ family sporulation protein [Paenibacillus oenotherae]
MSSQVGGAFTNTGTILVLFILLVIVACSCMGFVGGYGKGY